MKMWLAYRVVSATDLKTPGALVMRPFAEGEIVAATQNEMRFVCAGPIAFEAGNEDAAWAHAGRALCQ